MRKPAFCIYENKGADQLCGHRTADQRLCFGNIDSTIPPKFQASSHFPWLYSPDYVGPGRNPEDRFCSDAAHMSRVMRKQTFWFPTWSDTNQAVQLQKMARCLTFRI